MANLLIEHDQMAADGETDQRTPGLATKSQPPAGSTLVSDDLDGVCIESLEPGTALNVQTANSLYRIVVLDGPQHLVHICGGTAFTDDTLVRIEGATGRGSALKRGCIVVGFRMVIFLGRRRIKTSPVISVLNAP